MAIQYTFIVTTKPATMASQLKSKTTLGAATNMATVKQTLTISHKKNPATAVPGFIDHTLLVKPRAKSAAGITTANDP